MPEVTDPRILAQLGGPQPAQLPTQPQAFPGAVMPRTNARRVAQEHTKTQEELAREASQRAAEQLRLSQAAAAREQTKFEGEQGNYGDIGGVKPTEYEAKAASNAGIAANAARTLSKTLKEDPSAIQPGAVEAIMSNFGEGAQKAFASGSRQTVDQTFKEMVQALLYIRSGANAPEPEFQRQLNSVMPGYFDKEETIAAKKASFSTLLKAAQMAAGPMGSRVKEQIADIDPDSIFNSIRETQAKIASEEATASAKEVKPATEQGAWSPDPKLQSEYAQWLAQQTPGKLTAEAVADKYTELFRKYPHPLESPLRSFSSEPRSLEEFKDFVEYYNKTGAAGEYIPPRNEPVLDADAPSATGAMIGQFGNAMAMGIPELVDPQTKIALEAYAKEYPKASVTGDIAGSILPTVALEKLALSGMSKLAGRTLTDSGRGRLASQMAANSFYGGSRGAADAEEGERLGGAVKGSAIGAAIVPAVTVASRGAQGFMSSETRDAVNALVDDGVDLTSLQRMGAGRAEEGLQSFPIVRGAREKAAASWVKSTVNSRVLAPLGLKLGKNVPAGTAANEAASKALQAAYQEVTPLIQGTIDTPFVNGTRALKVAALALPDGKKFWSEMLPVEQALVKANSTFDGEGYRAAMSELREIEEGLARRYENSGERSALQMQRIVGKYKAQAKAMALRHVSPEVGKKLTALDKAYAHFVRIEDATNRALASGGKFSPAQLLTSGKKFDSSVRQTASARGKALGQEDTMNAVDVMGAKAVPENVNPWLAGASPLAIAGGASLSPATATGVGAAGAALYAPGVKKIVQKLLLDRRADPIKSKTVKSAIDNYLNQAPSAKARKEEREKIKK